MDKQKPSDASRLSADWSPFLTHLNQYKELLLLIVFFLGGLFWIYGYFATKKQLTELQCLTNLNVSLIVSRMEAKFYLDELAEQRMAAQRLIKIDTLSPTDQLTLHRIKGEIGVIRVSLQAAKKKYDSAFEKMQQGACTRQE